MVSAVSGRIEIYRIVSAICHFYSGYFFGINFTNLHGRSFKLKKMESVYHNFSDLTRPCHSLWNRSNVGQLSRFPDIALRRTLEDEDVSEIPIFAVPMMNPFGMSTRTV